jgi:putative transposase
MKNRRYGGTFFIDEVFIKINGKQHYLWRQQPGIK